MPGPLREFYVQFDRQGPVEAHSDEEAREKAALELVNVVAKAGSEPHLVEGLQKAGFSINSWVPS